MTTKKTLAQQIEVDDVPYFRQPFTRVRERAPVGEESMTHQSHAESCDINTIVGQFTRTGQLPPATKQGYYEDVTALQGKDLTELHVEQKRIAETLQAEQLAQQENAKKSKNAKKLETQKPAAETKNDAPSTETKPPAAE